MSETNIHMQIILSIFLNDIAVVAFRFRDAAYQSKKLENYVILFLEVSTIKY